MTLVDFLLARIAEDEQEAVATARMPSWPDTDARRYVDDNFGHEGVLVGNERWLAECEAKRRIITLASGAWNGSDCTECNEAGYMGDDLLRLLALPYADHPEFDEEWRP